MKATKKSTQTRFDRIASAFTEKLHRRYLTPLDLKKPHRGKHIRRVNSLFGFVLEGIRLLNPTDLRLHYVWQLQFELNGQWYKVRYNHRACFRGGIEIIEIGQENQGSGPWLNGKRVALIKDLQTGGRFYYRCRRGRWPQP